MAVNILVLAAGHAGFETKDGGYPLYLTEVDGVSVIERIHANARGVADAKFAFALLESDVSEFHLDNVVKLIAPKSRVICIPEGTQGSACTALLAASQMDAEAELLIVSANELVDVDYADVLSEFKRLQYDAGTIIFHSIHPRYSYVRLNADSLVEEAAQQNPISSNATAGIFWFSKTSDFLEAAKNIIRKNANVGGKFYVAPSFNEMILNQACVGVFRLGADRYKPLKSERQVQIFESGM